MTSTTYDDVIAMFDGRLPAPTDWDTCSALVDRLSARELGALQPLAWRGRNSSQYGDQVRNLAYRIADHERARFSPEAFAAGLDVLLDWLGPIEIAPPLTARTDGGMPAQNDRPPMVQALWTLIRGLETDPPVSTHDGLRRLQNLAQVSARHDLSGYVVARFIGDEAQAQINREKIMRRIEGDLMAREWTLIFDQPPLRLRDFQVIEMELDADKRHALLNCYYDSLPGYDAFAQEVFEIAAKRLGAIAARQTAYRADGAFVLDDCEAIEHAACYGLHRQAEWCLDRIGYLWRMAAVAPDPTAKTMPSQSLTIRLAHAAVAEPGPQTLNALDSVAAICRHAGVAKKLDRARKSARAALAAHPERLLGLDPAVPIEKAMLKPFATAVEGLLAQPEPIPALLWHARFGPQRREGWALAKALIWEITPKDGGPRITGLPLKSGGWSLFGELKRDFDESDTIRLWHPVEAADDLSRAWRSRLEQDDVKQPFLQAGREIYRPDPAEIFGRETALFAGREVSAMEMIGLARVSGWRSSEDSDLRLALAGVEFLFNAGVRTYHGNVEFGTTGSFRLLGPHGVLSKVPPRTLSEALRKLDLIVTVGERGRG